ncbi:hypothetical protein AMATHDRAFT_54218 [Amanita thiersii Skay4041]|uniref:Transmembrane protein n=1 Tax=Amanita thiersii Skay4041 TaxID=703135 RepID=A0A2A9NT61_9AGAR|nr:hypothetical protein AMATHDRAFT_54218 [Amanita thiersii Skay4041]
MPTLTITIEDNSPLLNYDGFNWGGSLDDNMASRYSESTFTRTSITSAQMSFEYNGTNVQVYGAQRSNHGQYQVSIDGTLLDPQNGNAGGDGNYKASLYRSENLAQGSHKLTLSNRDPDKWLDVDFVTWTVVFGDPKEALVTNTIDDTSPLFHYSGNDWSPFPANSGKFFAGTGHSTFTFNATASLTFVGEAISLYGQVTPNGAPYTIELDNNPPTNYNASRVESYQMLLYHANNLGGGNHTLTFRCTPSGSQLCALDYVNVYNSASNPASNSPSSGSSARTGLSIGDVIGIALGSVAVAIALVIVALYVIWRKKGGTLFGRHHQPAYATVSSFGPPMVQTPQAISNDSSASIPPPQSQGGSVTSPVYSRNQLRTTGSVAPFHTPHASQEGVSDAFLDRGT